MACCRGGAAAKPLIDPRKLRHLVTIEQRSATLDSLGQQVHTWATVAQDWAEAEPLRGREFFAAGQMQAPTTVRFTLRWRTGITPRMRVLWNGTPHDIEAAINVKGMDEALELMCATELKDAHG